MPSKTVTCVDAEGKEYIVSVDQLRWRPSVYGIVIKDGCLLVAPQSDGYHLPGGGVDLGETLEQALVREVQEETGITAKAPRLLRCEHSFFVLAGSEKGIFVQSLLFYYECQYESGELSTDGFTEDEKVYNRPPEWLPLKQLDDVKIASSFNWRPLIQQVLQHENHRH